MTYAHLMNGIIHETEIDWFFRNILIKHCLLEKGMANHFSILAMRAACTV